MLVVFIALAVISFLIAVMGVGKWDIGLILFGAIGGLVFASMSFGYLFAS